LCFIKSSNVEWVAVPHLDAKNLAFRYEDMAMRFDLAVERGTLLSIIGPSGAGKSTLLSLIGGFELPLSGAVLVDGADITMLAPAERPCTTLFQDHNLFAHLNVEHNVALGIDPSLRLSDAQRAEVRQSLADVGLAGMEHRSIACRASSPAASASAPPLRAAWCGTVRSCCWTSRSPRSARASGARCWTWCARCKRASASPSSW
jgi:hypothetical protein